MCLFAMIIRNKQSHHIVKDRLRKPFGHQELLIQCFILLSTKLKKRAWTVLGNKEGDLKRWCSTKVDFRGVHIGGKGNWGICGNDCPSDEIDNDIHFRIKD